MTSTEVAMSGEACREGTIIGYVGRRETWRVDKQKFLIAIFSERLRKRGRSVNGLAGYAGNAGIGC